MQEEQVQALNKQPSPRSPTTVSEASVTPSTAQWVAALRRIEQLEMDSALLKHCICALTAVCLHVAFLFGTSVGFKLSGPSGAYTAHLHFGDSLDVSKQ